MTSAIARGWCTGCQSPRRLRNDGAVARHGRLVLPYNYGTSAHYEPCPGSLKPPAESPGRPAMSERQWRYGDRGRPSHRPEPRMTHGHVWVCAATSPDGVVCGRGISWFDVRTGIAVTRAARHHPRPYGRAGNTCARRIAR